MTKFKSAGQVLQKCLAAFASKLKYYNEITIKATL